MKNNILLTIVIACLTPYFLAAQITITNATFPTVGDVWGVALDSNVLLSNIYQPTNTNVTWDFSDGSVNSLLDNHLEYDEFVKSPADGGQPGAFPTADIMLPFFGGEGYFEDNGNTIDAIGFYGDPFGALGKNITGIMNDPLTFYNAPMTFGSTFMDTGGFYTELGPGTISAGGISTGYDSLKVLYQAEIRDTVDAYGTLITPTGTYNDVLRISRVEYRFTEALATVPLFGEVDLSIYLDELGHDTIWTIIYRDANTSQNLVEIDLKWTGSTNVYTTKSAKWLIPPISVDNKNIVRNNTIIKAFPNPAVNYVNFEMNGVNAGNYTFDIYNILGRRLKSESHELNSDATIYMNIEDLAKGAYLYSIKDATGEILNTKKLLVNRP